MRLIEELMLKAQAGHRGMLFHGCHNSIKADDRGKFFGRGTHQSAEPLLQRTLTDEQFCMEFFNADGAFAVIDHPDGFEYQPIGLYIFQPGKEKTFDDVDTLPVGMGGEKLFFSIAEMRS